MKWRPMLFSGPMVRAILDGSKTQTRRALRLQPPPGTASMSIWHHPDPRPHFFASDGQQLLDFAIHCPHGAVGDGIWVRESWRTEAKFDHLPPNKLPEKCPFQCEADGMVDFSPGVGRLRPGIHMPRWASRISLEVVSVRVERLQDISEADAQAEGCSVECMTPTGDDSGSAIHGPGGYKALWDSINGDGAWDADPYVWVISFRRLP